MTERIYNFSAGPAVLPLSVLEQVQRDMVALPGVGMSIVEISHRSKAFDEIIQGAQADMRKLAGIPDNYHILFLQGGASLQFSMVPMIADASSDIFSHPLNVSKYAMIYAGAQKNLAPAGVTLAIMRDDLLARSPASLHTMLNYNTHAKENSLYNTPPVFAIYVMRLV